MTCGGAMDGDGGPPSPCDKHAVRMNGRYTGDTGPGPGGSNAGNIPGACSPCEVVACTDYQVCTRSGTASETCGPVEQRCSSTPGCCKNEGTGTAAWNGCGEWVPGQACPFGGACCFDPSSVPPESCGSHGLFDGDQQAQCEDLCPGSGTCLDTRLRLTWPDSTATVETSCWQCGPCVPGDPPVNIAPSVAQVGDSLTFSTDAEQLVPGTPVLWDLGNATHLSGNPLTYVYPQTGSFAVILTVTEKQCDTTRVLGPRTVTITGCVSSGCPTGACGSRLDGVTRRPK